MPTPARASEAETTTAVTLMQRPVHRLPLPHVGELVQHAVVGLPPCRFLGRPVVEGAGLTGRDVADERRRSHGEVGLGRSGEMALHRMQG